MKNQIVIIGGGDAFKNYGDYLSFLKNCEIDFKRYLSTKRDWKSTIADSLGNKFGVVVPPMPNKNSEKIKNGSRKNI